MTRLGRFGMTAGCIGLLVIPRSASAQLTFSGTINSSDPSMNLVSIVPPNCGPQVAAPVRYETFVFSVPISARYTVRMASFPIGAFYLYESAFDPLNGALNCIAASFSQRETSSPSR